MSYSDIRAKQKQLIEGMLEAFFVLSICMVTIYQGIVWGFYICHSNQVEITVFNENVEKLREFYLVYSFDCPFSLFQT